MRGFAWKLRVRRVALTFAALFGVAHGVGAFAADVEARYRALIDGVPTNPLRAPVTVQSEQRGDLISADVWGVLEQPFAQVTAVAASPERFCDFISIVIFVKACTYADTRAPTTVTLYMGRKDYEDPDPDNALAFQYSVEAGADDHLAVRLFVAEGLLGVKENRTDFELWSIDGRTLAHVRASYIASTQSKFALGTYLMTLGRNKVGFTIAPDADGKPAPIKGTLGIIERNTMRYFLALQSYLDMANVEADQLETARIGRWFDATAKYEQLYEIPREEFLENKKRERANQLELQRKVETKP